MARIEYKYIVAIVTVFGLFMELLDATIVNVAIPTLAQEFDVPTTSIEWIVTGYLLSLAVFIPVSGWAGDRFGTKRTFLFALVTFTGASALCAVAWNIESLILFRVLQGVGGGMLTPVGTAMMFRAFPPHERSRASGFMVIPTTIAPASGPILGGFLVEYTAWEWIFLINIPIGLLGIFVAARYLREHREPDAGRFDPYGFVLAAGGLGLLLYALSEAGSKGFDEPLVWVFGAVSLVLLVLFCVVELRIANPMVDIRLFKSRLFTACNLAQFASMASLAGALFLLPIFLQLERGLSPFQSGLTTFPQALGVMAAAQPTAWLYHRVGPKRLMLVGASISVVTSLLFVRIDLETSQWWIRVLMLFRGVGFGMMLVPLQAATFSSVPPALTGRASSVFSSGRMVAQSLGVAIGATILSTRLGHYDAFVGGGPGVPQEVRDGAVNAFHDAFIGTAAIALIGVIVILWLVRDRDAAASMRPRTASPPVPDDDRVAAPH